MSEIENYVSHVKRGISTRHLSQHLDFIKYRKILNYTYEYLDRNIETYTSIRNKMQNSPIFDIGTLAVSFI